METRIKWWNLFWKRLLKKYNFAKMVDHHGKKAKHHHLNKHIIHSTLSEYETETIQQSTFRGYRFYNLGTAKLSEVL